MDKEFWLKKWRSNDIAFHQEQVNPALKECFSLLNLQPTNTVLVPLCGKTKDMLWLAAQGLQVIGVELSELACEDFFKENNLSPLVTREKEFVHYNYKNIDLLCGDFFSLSREMLPPIEAVYDCKALIALPPDLRKQYVSHLKQYINNKTSILLLSLEAEDFTRNPPFPVSFADIKALYSDQYNIEKLKTIAMQPLAEHLIQKGFKNVEEVVYLIKHV